MDVDCHMKTTIGVEYSRLSVFYNYEHKIDASVYYVNEPIANSFLFSLCPHTFHSMGLSRHATLSHREGGFLFRILELFVGSVGQTASTLSTV